jgi:glycosyltransferase involved in cell wall biosynthesis
VTSVFGIHDYDEHTSAPTGCGWYRIIMPLAELAKHDGWATAWKPNRQPPRRYDIVHAQRLDRAEGLADWRRLAAGSRLVYDIDDDLWTIRMSNWRAYQTFTARAKETVTSYGRYSDLITVSTEPLADIMRQRTGRPVTVLPNRVPGWLLDHDRPRRDKVVVGWAGGASHAEDVALIAGQVRRAIAGSGGAAELHLIGNDYRRTFQVPGVRHTNWVPVNEGGAYYKTVDFDIALAPLIGSPFDESKSAIKALEAMALGIPVIASAVTAYRGTVIDGVTGYLIDQRRKSDWGKRIRDLICDPQQRAEMGANARAAAKAHTIETGWQLWAAAYEGLT